LDIFALGGIGLYFFVASFVGMKAGQAGRLPYFQLHTSGSGDVSADAMLGFLHTP